MNTRWLGTVGALALSAGCARDPDEVNPRRADVVVVTDDGVTDVVTVTDAVDAANLDAGRDAADVVLDGAIADADVVSAGDAAADAADAGTADRATVDADVVTPPPDAPVTDVPTVDVGDAGAATTVRVNGSIRAVGTFADPSRGLRIVGTIESAAPVCDRARGICITGGIAP